MFSAVLARRLFYLQGLILSLMMSLQCRVIKGMSFLKVGCLDYGSEVGVSLPFLEMISLVWGPSFLANRIIAKLLQKAGN